MLHESNLSAPASGSRLESQGSQRPGGRQCIKLELKGTVSSVANTGLQKRTLFRGKPQEKKKEMGVTEEEGLLVLG